MKKLLIFMLVLGLVSSASAVPTISGSSTIAVGGTNTYTVSGTAAEASSASYTGGGYSAVIWRDYYTAASQFSNVGSASTAMGAGGSAALQVGTAYNYVSFVAAPDVQNPAEAVDVDAGEWFTFDFSAASGAEVGDTYGIELWDSSYSGILSELVVTVVPEPMTIALLGLGGLFLKRRK